MSQLQNVQIQDRTLQREQEYPQINSDTVNGTTNIFELLED